MSVDEGTGSFDILFVCTGNLCRSPMAERMLASRVPERAGLSIASAGTRAPHGAPMDRASAAELHRLGGSSVGFTARRLDRTLIDGADLVLCMAREHRAAVAKLVPAATRKSFTLPEFCRLAAGVERGDGSLADAHRIVRAVRGRRGLVPPASPEDDDIVDPIHQPRPVVAACAVQISSLTDSLREVFKW